MEKSPASSKRERTRNKLLLATAECLEQKAYTELRSMHITERADLAEGTFYVHFKSKEEAVTAVMKDFLASSVLRDTPQDQAYSAFEAIRAANRAWLQTVKANPGLIRSVFQRIEIDPEFAAEYADMNFRWHEVVADAVIRRYPEGSVDRSAVLFAVVTLDAMTVEVAKSLFVTKTEVKGWGALANKKSIDDVVDVLSINWFRILYPASELSEDITSASQKILDLASRKPNVSP